MKMKSVLPLSSFLIILFIMLTPQGLADYPELMKAVKQNTGEPKWYSLGHASNPVSHENATLDLFLDINSLQNIAAPWVAYRTLEVYTPYSTSVSMGKKVGGVTSMDLLNCQTQTHVPIYFIMMNPEKQIIAQKVFTEALPKTSAPNAPSYQIGQLICDMTYHEKPQSELSSDIVPTQENKKGPEWVAFAESKQPDKTVTMYYDKKSFIHKNNDLLYYTTRETYNPFTFTLLQNQKVTSRITQRVSNCPNRQEALISRAYYGIGGKELKTQSFDKNAFHENNPRTIDEAVRNDVCLFMDSLPNMN